MCIIDDREDVWNFAPNVVPVKPYQFFSNTGDINSPFKASDDKNFFPSSSSSSSAAPAPPAAADLPTPPLLDSDSYLLQLETILTKIHTTFYQKFDEKHKYCHESEAIKVPDLKVRERGTRRGCSG